jgi:hypothetical protein
VELGDGVALVAGAAVALSDPLADALAEGVARAAADDWVDGTGVGVALVVTARGFVAAAFVAVDVAAFFVGAFVGVGLGLGGVAPGARCAVLLCQASPTDPPAGTVSDRAPFVEYTHPPPSDQNRPQ